MTSILAITNQKGGVGKTTTSVNLAAGLSILGKKVLLVDLDPQGNATMGSGIDKNALSHSIYQGLLGICSMDSVIIQSASTGYDVLPTNRELAGAEVELIEFEDRHATLRKRLEGLAPQYDFILIDTPPSLSLLTLNALCAATGVLIPMQCEYYALEGLSDLVNTIRRVHHQFNPTLAITGLLRVMYDQRNMLGQQVSAQLEQHFKDKVFQTIIPRNIRLAEAPSYGLPGVLFDKHAKGAQAYLALSQELINKTTE